MPRHCPRILVSGGLVVGRWRRRTAWWQPILLLSLAPFASAQTSLGDWPTLVQKYENLLLLDIQHCGPSTAARAAIKDELLPLLDRAVRNAREFAYDWAGEPALFSRRPAGAPALTARETEIAAANTNFRRLVLDILPKLAYAYRVPGAADVQNPHYRSSEVLRLYLAGLEYAYSRGVTEEAWLPDHAGRASVNAMESGLTRPSGDVSQLSLRLGGFVQGIFLMRKQLAAAGLLDRYRSVARNLALNNGTMYPAFFPFAREEAGIQYETPLSRDESYHLNADGIRLFVDSFWPYFLLIEDTAERNRMSVTAARVIAANLAVKPGSQGLIKPDGTGFHHATAYVGGYTPGAFEAAAQLLYLAKRTAYVRPENVAAVKSALQAYRVMVQKYSVSPSLSGRLIRGSGLGSTDQVARAFLFMGHPDGADDFDMRARFHEFFDEEHFLAPGRQRVFYEGVRGIAIRALGVYRLVADLQRVDFPPADQPSGVWVKPYAAAAFFRRSDWLVTAKGFSQYFWDYEGTENENSLGQNWAYGLLQVFSAGTPVSHTGSGYDLANGWDWYHVPGTTASHYAIERMTESELRRIRRDAGVGQRDVHRNYNTRTFVGGVTLGDFGFFVQDLEAVPFTSLTDLTARKTYFFVGDRVLALGTHIRGGTTGDETHTTLFQTRLADADDPTWLNGRQLTGLSFSREIRAGSNAAMIDSVGNSYYLASSTAELVLTRRLQSSLTDGQEPSEGAYATAYLDHGIKPRRDSYEYVLIPADSHGSKLRAVQQAPDSYYQVLERDTGHIVRFPQHGVTAFAFYELAETPSGELVRQVDRQAAVIVEKVGATVRLAASVPDIGWQFEDTIRERGLAYASQRFARQEAKVHSLRLDLRGRWSVYPGAESVESEIAGDGTIVRMQVRDGMSTEIFLSPAL